MVMTLPKPTGGFEWTQAAPGPVLRCRPLLEIAPHLFTTASIELRDGDPAWSIVAEELGVPAGAIHLLRQVHGCAVTVARRGEPVPAVRPEADLIVSDDPETGIGVRVADCAPILLADRRDPAVAAAHAGWRGALQDVAGAAVRSLQATFGSRPADLVVAIGPSLGACCGEMGSEVVEAFRSAGCPATDLDRWFTPGPRGRPHFDLPRAARDQLERAGVPAASIHLAGLCTRCRPDVFHSYRAAGASAGRMVGAIRARAGGR
jgi:YfiH family protein